MDGESSVRSEHEVDHFSHSNTENITQVPKYEFVKYIDSGTFGDVYEAVRIDDGLRVIIKVILKHKIRKWVAYDPNSNTDITINYEKLPFEVICLLKLRSIHSVIQIYDYYEMNGHCFIVMEKFERSVTLFDMFNDKPFGTGENNLKKIFQQIIETNILLLSNGVFHRDIKPENILVNKDNFRIKLIDFGSAANYPRFDKVYKKASGTLEFLPPEWFAYKYYFAEPCTVWSIGVSLFYCMYGRYATYENVQTLSTIAPTLYSKNAEHCFQILNACLSSFYRPTLIYLLNLPWLKEID